MNTRQRLVRATLLMAGALASMPALAQMTLGEIAGAAQRSGDKSREALVAIFGNVVNDPLSAAGDTDTVLAGIFMVTNATLLVIGGFIVCYHFVRKLSQTAHDGTVFDQQKHVLWGPIRILWGVASLVPTPNGWSLAQLLMLWGASVIGVGSANLAVDQATAAFDTGNSMVTQPVLPSTVKLAQGLFEAHLCMHGINRGLAVAAQNGALIPSDEYINLHPTATGFSLSNSSFVCGGSNLNEFIPSTHATNGWFSNSIPLDEIRNAHLYALQTMQADINQSASTFVDAVVRKQQNSDTVISDAETAIQLAAANYEKYVNAVAAEKQGDIRRLASELGAALAKSGWWTLGAWYQTFAQANTKLSDAVAAKASVYGVAANGDPAMLNLYSTALTAYKAQQARSTYTPPIGTSSTGEYTRAAVAEDPIKVIGSVFAAPGQRFVNALVNINADGAGLGQVNPLIKMKNIGDYTIAVADTGLAVLAAAKGAELASKWIDIGGIGSKIAGVISKISSILLMIVVALFLLGGALSVYLPLVPSIIWFGAAINWLIVVGEAVIAAPLWAVTHLRGEGGDGLGSHSTYGWIFLLNVMIRPLLMVCGFFLGGACLIAGGTLLNQIFGISIANVQFDSMTGLVSVLFFMAVYASMAMNLVHTCFNLIFIVPDQVIAWIGGHASTALGREDNDRMRQAVTVFSNKMEDGFNRLERLTRGDNGPRTPRSGNGFRP